MLKVDLIVPYMTPIQRFSKIPKVNNLKYLYWFPVWYYKKDLEKMGVKIRFLNLFDLKHIKLSKIVGIDSKIPYVLQNFDTFRKKLKKVDFTIWFDHSDNAGNSFFPALRYFDRYLKRQIFKDHSLYRKEFYRRAFFVDYYIRNYNLERKGLKPIIDIPDPSYDYKIGLSWNFAFSDYRFSSVLTQYLYKFFRVNTLRFYEPRANRKLLFSTNYNIHRNRKYIYFQRVQLLKFLRKKYKSNPNISLGHVSKKTYLANMRNSKAIFSPFGWGEGCFRDFDVFISGAALIKPNMDHLETWPDIYINNETYIPLSWKIEDWDNQTTEILGDEEYLLKIARNGQDYYKKLWTEEGKKAFCDHFIKMVTPN